MWLTDHRQGENVELRRDQTKAKLYANLYIALAHDSGSDKKYESLSVKLSTSPDGLILERKSTEEGNGRH